MVIKLLKLLSYIAHMEHVNGGKDIDMAESQNHTDVYGTIKDQPECRLSKR